MGWPSRPEREQLERFPAEIALQDLRGSFTLKAGDRDLVFSQHGPARLGVAVALCALRFMGFVPDELASIPEHALLWVCDQLEAEPTELLAYGGRAQTRSDDLAAIRTHLGFRMAGPQDLDRLARWLVGRVLEHDAPSALFSLAAEYLLARRIVRPSVDQLARMITTAREAAHYAGTSSRLRSNGVGVLVRFADDLVVMCHSRVEAERALAVGNHLRTCRWAPGAHRQRHEIVARARVAHAGRAEARSGPRRGGWWRLGASCVGRAERTSTPSGGSRVTSSCMQCSRVGGASTLIRPTFYR